MTTAGYVTPLSALGRGDMNRAGGKGANLCDGPPTGLRPSPTR
ncbi:MAG: hypothetical protein ACRDYA_05120 [Egibacteraceae bacterium]